MESRRTGADAGRALVALTLLGAVAALGPAEARANGNCSHQWCSDRARESLHDGALKALLARPELQPILHNGTMFPDWGYTPSSDPTIRDAGEAAHWEPLQEAYRRWIVENFAPPWSDEAAEHIAFYLGMTSHGMADQVYDSMFMERAKRYEPAGMDQFDHYTDVLWAAHTGPANVPSEWIPFDPLLALWAEVHGLRVSPAAVSTGQNFLRAAISLVNAQSQQADQVANAAATYPWAAAHHDDPAVPGNPPYEAEIIRRYWRSNYELMLGFPLGRPVLWTWPPDGAAGHPVDASSIESWITVVFARGLEESALSTSQFSLVDSQGQAIPLSPWLFYGRSAHCVHLRPQVDLIDDEVYTLTIAAGLATIHGERLDGWSLRFSTGERAVDPIHDDAWWDRPDEPLPGDGDDAADDGPGDHGDEAATAADEADADEPGAAGDGGCGCGLEGRGPPGALVLLTLVGLLPALGRRRGAPAAEGSRRPGRALSS